MRKKIAFIFYKIIIFIDSLIFKVFKKNFRYYLYDYLRSDSYYQVESGDFKIKLFTPSSVSRSRAEKFFSKEPDTIEWINRFCLENNKKIIFWDIGSNIGTFSIYAGKKHNDIEIYAFEPSTSNLGLLSKNINLNNLTNKIRINPLPLTTQSNQFLLMNEKHFVEGGAQNTFGEDYDFEGKKFSTNNSYNILGTSINNLIENDVLKVPNYIKIDVDGIENLILRGATKVLKNENLKSILVEINENFKNQHTEVKNILKENGFEETSKFHSSSKKDRSHKYSMIYNYIFHKN